MADTNNTERLMELIDAYAEARHVCGCAAYNAKTAKARKAVIDSIAAGGEPVGTVYTMEALVPGGGVKHHVQLHAPLPAGTNLYTAPQPAHALEDGWISVLKRLPESDEAVLVHNGRWTGVGAWMSGDYLEPLERWQDERREFIEMCGPSVTHWRPLPAPPLSPNASKEGE